MYELDSRLVVRRPIGRRRRRSRLVIQSLVALLVVVGVWLGLSFWTVHQLIRRSRPIYPEPPPKITWGTIEPIRLKTSDGEELGAWFVNGEATAGSVLLLHGNGADRSALVPAAEVFARRGLSVLMVTERAHGDSTGEINDVGYSARFDCAAGVDYLKSRRPNRPIIVVGQSLGAAAAIFAAPDLGSAVAGYALECPYTDLKTALRRRAEMSLPWPLSLVGYAGMRIAAAYYLPHLAEIAPIEAIKNVPAEATILILAGGQDRRSTLADVDRLAAAAGKRARVRIFAKAGHLNFVSTEPEDYRHALTTFVDQVKAGREEVKEPKKPEQKKPAAASKAR